MVRPRVWSFHGGVSRMRKARDSFHAGTRPGPLTNISSGLRHVEQRGNFAEACAMGGFRFPGKGHLRLWWGKFKTCQFVCAAKVRGTNQLDRGLPQRWCLRSTGGRWEAHDSFTSGNQLYLSIFTSFSLRRLHIRMYTTFI